MKHNFIEGDLVSFKKHSQRSIYVTKTMTEDAKTLIKLLGLPVIEVKNKILF